MKIKLLLVATIGLVILLLGHALLAEPLASAGVAIAKEPEPRTLVLLGAALLTGAALLRRSRIRG